MTFPKVTLYYFDIPGSSVTRGLGENIKLFLVDANIDHVYKRVTKKEWETLKPELESKGHVSGTLPAVEIEGQVYGNTAPILRHLSKRLGKYNSSDPQKEHLLDALSDIVNDWSAKQRNQMYSASPKSPEEYYKDVTGVYLGRLEAVYEKRGGPYILGQDISYTDFFIYHQIDGEQLIGTEKLETFQNLKKFVNAFQTRDRISEHLLEVKDAKCPDPK